MQLLLKGNQLYVLNAIPSDAGEKIFSPYSGNAYSRTNWEEAIHQAASSFYSRMTSVTPADVKVPPSNFSPPEGPGSGGDAGRTSSSNSGTASPNYVKWAENLHLLLNDGTGVELLLKYLEQEDQDCFYMLRFWLAVRGSHQQPDQDQTNKCILAIYKGLFNKIKSGISDELRRYVTQTIRQAQAENKPLDSKVFAEACKVVENIMNDRMYPNFLSSDLYLTYVRDMQRDTSAVDNNKLVELPKNFCQTLPIVNEDEELSFDAYHTRRHGSGSVTYSTASTRLLHEQSCRTASNLHHLSYNPVSRQDSEVQSLSSGARTDSMPDLSLDDATGMFGSSMGSTYAQRRRQMGKVKDKPVIMNRNTDLVHIQEPRSSQPGIRERTNGPNPLMFMNTLLPKLEQLRRERETQELVEMKLESIDEDVESNKVPPMDDDDQDILDRHVSRVWNEQTPKRSPCVGTPVRPKSPETRRARSVHGCGSSRDNYPPSSWAPSTWSTCSGSLRRRDKDVYSLFSMDSGNGTDQEHQYRNLYKSKSVSDYGEHGASANARYSGHYPQGNRMWAGSRRTMTDSGVSVAESTGIAPSQRSRDKMTTWQTDKRLPSARSRSVYGSGSQLYDEKDAFPMPARSKSKSSHCSSKTRSDFLNPKSGVPAQPFMADPSMPPLSYYSIDPQTTVEEATRRLEAWKGTRGCSNVQSNIVSHSSQRSLNEANEFTSVVYNFTDENVPYLLKVPARHITLKIFKDHSPKKGNFRYFFQTECEELGGDTPIYEEVKDDDSVLPLWKNKIISKITIR